MKDCPHTSGIVVAFYSTPNDIPKYMPVTNVESITSEELCIMACKHIGIGSVGYYLCGIVPVNQATVNTVFLPPGYVIAINGTPRLNFVLRIIFYPPLEEKKMKKLKEQDAIVVQYFYSQCFDDFRNDRYTLNDLQRDVLGVALLDNLLHNRVLEANEKHNLLYDRVLEASEKQKATHFIPRNYKHKSFDRFYNRWRLNKQFEEKLKEVNVTFKDHDITSLQITNLASGLFKLVKNYGMETFEAAEGSDFNCVRVDPYGTRSGLILISQTVDQNGQQQTVVRLLFSIKYCMKLAAYR
jgi:hypothetical protein